MIKYIDSRYKKRCNNTARVSLIVIRTPVNLLESVLVSCLCALGGVVSFCFSWSCVS